MHHFKIKHLQTEQQKRKRQNCCSEHDTEEWAVPCCRCTTDTASGCHHAALPPSHGSVFPSPITSGPYSWIPSSQLDISNRSDFTENRDYLATWGEAHVWLGCLLPWRGGRLKSHLPVGTVLWKLMPYKRSDWSTQGACPVLEPVIFSFNLVKSCKLMGSYTLRRYIYILRKHKKLSKDKSKQGSKDRNMQNIL